MTFVFYFDVYFLSTTQTRFSPGSSFQPKAVMPLSRDRTAATYSIDSNCKKPVHHGSYKPDLVCPGPSTLGQTHRLCLRLSGRSPSSSPVSATLSCIPSSYYRSLDTIHECLQYRSRTPCHTPCYVGMLQALRRKTYPDYQCSLRRSLQSFSGLQGP